jgi:nucleoside-diphosphate-sugar epimerase
LVSKSKILVTGASGYVGSSLCNYLDKKGNNTIKVSKKNIKNRVNLNLKLESSWEKIFEKSDKIVHLSAVTSLHQCEKNRSKTNKENILPIKKLIVAAKKINFKPHIIFASTATIYGSVRKYPVSEKKKVNPSSVYDNQKLTCENLLKNASKEGILRSTVLRFSNIYGPSFSDTHFIDRGILNKIINKAISGNNITIYGHGNYLRDYIYITDVISAIDYSLRLQKKSFKIYNVGTQKYNSIKKVFNIIKKRINKSDNSKILINYCPWPISSHKIEKRNFVADISKIKNELGWSPQIDIDMGIKKTINFFRRKNL